MYWKKNWKKNRNQYVFLLCNHVSIFLRGQCEQLFLELYVDNEIGTTRRKTPKPEKKNKTETAKCVPTF
jgi:hypothetical protein